MSREDRVMAGIAILVVSLLIGILVLGILIVEGKLSASPFIPVVILGIVAIALTKGGGS